MLAKIIPVLLPSPFISFSVRIVHTAFSNATFRHFARPKLPISLILSITRVSLMYNVYIHLARKKLFLYNMYIEELHPLASGQVMNLILSLKKGFLQFAATERWLGWGEVVFYAQLFSHIKKVIEQRLFVDLDVKVLNEMLASLVEEFSQQNQT